jgi:hypothetical protein
MNNTQKEEDFTKLKSSVEDIAGRYFECLKKLASSKRGKSHSLYVKRVKDAYSKLDTLEQNFINNEFFYQDYPDWWKKLYSKTTFYRIKRQSMKDFLEAFNRDS